MNDVTAVSALGVPQTCFLHASCSLCSCVCHISTYSGRNPGL